MPIQIPVVEVIAGTTLRSTWVNSGVTPSQLTSALLSGSETLVSSVTPISSGDGHYFGPLAIPASGPAWYVNEWRAVIASNTYTDRQLVRVVQLRAG